MDRKYVKSAEMGDKTIVKTEYWSVRGVDFDRNEA